MRSTIISNSGLVEVHYFLWILEAFLGKLVLELFSFIVNFAETYRVYVLEEPIRLYFKTLAVF